MVSLIFVQAILQRAYSVTTGCALLCATVGHMVVKFGTKSMGLQRVVTRTCTKLSEHPVMLT
jgi:anthranilate phosphoribosyltransferase